MMYRYSSMKVLLENRRRNKGDSSKLQPPCLILKASNTHNSQINSLGQTSTHNEARMKLYTAA